MRAIDNFPFVSISVRGCEPADLEPLLALARAEKCDAERLRRELCASPPWLSVLVAEEGGQLLGFVSFAVVYADGKPVLKVETLVVPTMHRVVGVGHELLHACIAEAHARACTQVELASDGWTGIIARQLGAGRCGSALTLPAEQALHPDAP